MKLPVTKLRITIGSIALAVLLAVVFSACGSQYTEKITLKAELLSLRVRAGSSDLSMEGANIPAPIINRNWVDEDYDLYNEDFKTLSFKLENDLDEVWFSPTFTPGAKVKWGVASRSVRPNENNWKDFRASAAFDPRDFIYFQVTSEDGETTNYYRFSTYVSSPVKELSSIKLAGREGDIFAPDEIWNGDLLKIGNFNITGVQAASAEIVAEPWDPTATVKYAVTPYAAAVEEREAPVFQDNRVLSFSDGDFLYVEVTAENTIDKNIYLFTVFVGRIATIGKLTFTNPGREAAAEGTGTFEALGKGTAKNYWSDNTGAGSFDSPHQPPSGFTFAVELDDPEGSWQYAKVSGLPSTSTTPNNSNQPAWSTRRISGDTIPDYRLEHNEYLAIKIIPPNRQGSSPDYFYKVKIGLLAAEFTVQPKSHVHQVNTPADPLSFTLDRTISNPAYQWYEANSWYGGYGFDSEGRIGQREPLVAETGWGDNDKGILHADGTVTYYGRDVDLPDIQDGDISFDVSEWHVIDLDEKDNVSLHNGGNKFYRLPTPGRPIPGATGATYTPPVSDTEALGSGKNRRPFITNFSNESHYYWVEVTDKDTGLKAVSARAVVVTEWGEQYHNGHANGEKVEKEHYIIDLYAYQTPGQPGLQAVPRNAIPFNAGNHGDSYWIPVTFPEGFDIMDYSVFTAQALFFLADGREWIQNWTQGDIGFGRTKRIEEADGSITLVPGEREEIVLWYNLTNDNATRGLASSGNEPQGSGLSETPEFIVVKPAGTKPINRMPPFTTELDSVGRYKPDTKDEDAQGWFTPYIELSELRFEGPAREKPED